MYYCKEFLGSIHDSRRDNTQFGNKNRDHSDDDYDDDEALLLHKDSQLSMERARKFVCDCNCMAVALNHWIVDRIRQC